MLLATVRLAALRTNAVSAMRHMQEVARSKTKWKYCKEKTNYLTRLNGKVRSFKFTRHAFRRQFIIPAICIRFDSSFFNFFYFFIFSFAIFLVRLSRLDANTRTQTHTIKTKTDDCIYSRVNNVDSIGLAESIAYPACTLCTVVAADDNNKPLKQNDANK